MFGPIRAVIFDMDGVLVNSEPLWRRAMVKGFTSIGIDFTEDDCRKTTGRRFTEVVEYWLNYFRLSHIKPIELEKKVIAELLILVEQEGEAIDGILPILDFCKTHKLKTGLATSSSHELMNAVLKKLNLEHYFDAAISAEYMKYGKPHPEVFLECALKIATEPSECLVIEDSLNGVIAAKAAHMQVIAVPDAEHKYVAGFAVADYTCFNMNEALHTLTTLL
jgi:mannitol-1-/sugar-/sorbitol-6-/2-deoxyglucose-6-phosphatase